MLDFNKLFKLAKEKGIEDIQISYSSETAKEISYTDKELDSFSINTNSRLSAKGIYNKKMGSYSTELIDESEFDNIVNKIIESAKYITNEDEVFIYEGDKEYGSLENPYNKEVDEIDIKEKMSLCEETINKSLTLDKVTHAECGYGESINEVMVANSKGLNLKEKTNNFTIFLEVVVSDGKDTRTDYTVYSSNDFSSINKDSLIEKAYDKAYKSLGAKPIKSGLYETVLSENATNTLLSVFEGVFSSERNQKGLSILKNRVGEKIGSDKVTIVDDPLYNKSGNGTTFDSDGVATRYKEVVKDGVFKGFVYNLKTAKKENTKSTGNSTGSSCSLFIPYFKPGKKTMDEIIKSVENGIYIDSVQGAHAGANEMSLDFSLQAKGFKIEEGKLTDPIALITISANFLDLLKDVTEVSSEIKNSIDATGIKVKKLAISGK